MKPRLRVAFVHDSYSTYRRPLFRLLAEKFDIRWFFLNEDPALLPPNAESVRGWRIPQMSDLVVAPGLYSRILAAHRQNPFDVIVCPEPANFSAWAAYRAARAIGRPHVVFSGEWYPARHPRRWLSRPIESAVIRNAAVCLAYGNKARERLMEMGAPQANIRVTGNAGDYAFRPASKAALAKARAEWQIGGRPVILFLGRMLPIKGVDTLIDAFRLLREKEEAVLLLAGEGPALPALRRRVETAGLADIRFTGKEVRTAGEKNLLYSLARIFVLPSRRTRVAEAWGLVLNEAAAAGLAIVASRWVGAAGDLIRSGETGILVDDNDPLAQETALLRYLREPQTAKAYGERARSAAAGFTVRRMARAFGEAFERAASGVSQRKTTNAPKSRGQAGGRS
jgi:glycosyltransferase involved in cell wall biosynthesis